jgi:aflatoxin B1 aldehyde reductase
MAAVQTLYEKGKIEKFGLSNFTKEQVLDYYNYAKSKEYILPTIYQCSYSIAVRLNETRLFPTLRKLGMSIQAYSPMAAGFLAKTPEYIEQGKGSWDPETPTGQVYRDMYFKPSYMKMLADFGKLSKDSGISRSGLAYRWVRYHSALKGGLGDEIILGAASAEQLKDTLVELEKGPLDSWIVEKIDGFWQLIQDEAPIDNLKSVRKVFRSLLSG